ncbi:MAG TPA: pyridoxamine 5'-phosphate oxidase family protein [Candidatus Paceibacterota bacterium]|nr:pyridoxamine 5'-phosphate oxidase family protein [Verrucomicrobiota bacterium]HRY48986.1 pyridoxamine 5'-phosphate oxidase family protein [Candidatus Paceibacterota bacterium]HSA00794.1 pyridoxamine 5'-phosphate oxidase family protein [Candidatus Paceibacterota bacterium]
MRRTDKEITDPRQIDEIIRDSLVCRVAMAKDNAPYVVPMSFGYDGAAIYLHTAPGGKKVECFEANPQVCFEFERNVELRRNPQIACKWSFNFESVIGYGTISELAELAQKEHALNEIMRQYSGKTWPFESASVAKVRVWKIAIASMTGKQSKPKVGV